MPADLERVERALRHAVHTDDAYLTELASHLLVAGGKRMRPAVALAASLTGRPAVSDDVVQGGVACELVHLGSLYHDDVIDEAESRRGVDTVNAKWGNLQAILAGDFLLARASEIAASLSTEVAGLLANTIGRLCFGEIGQLRTTYDVGRTHEQYLTSIGGKTAALFSTAARIGALVGDLDRSMVDALTAYGRALGMVFQIVDDVLDLTATEAELGKPVGHDLVEGVYTLPVIHTLREGGVAGDELGELLGRPLGQAEVDKALAIVRSNGGVPVALTEGERYRDEAIVALADLPASPVTHALRSAPDALLASTGAR
jgi:heptaprenyl diphosphate synthase